MTVRFWKCRYKTMMIKTLSVTFPFTNLPFEPFFYRLSLLLVTILPIPGQVIRIKVKLTN